MEKDYSLLRPFDLEAAKRGEKLLNGSGSGDERSYVDGPDYFEVVCVKGKEGGLYLNSIHEMKMYPLAWVEGRPVYKGDVLYWNTQSSDSGSKFTATGFLEEPNYIAGVSLLSDGDRLGEDGLSGMRPENLTWQKPKTKREGWMNLYESGENYVYPTKLRADSQATFARIGCIRIEWKE